MRVSGYDAHSNGWITNNELGVDGNPSRDYGVRVEFLDKLSDNVTAQVTFRHSSIVSGGNEYTPVPNISSFTYDMPAFQPQTNRRTTDGAIFRLDAAVGEDSFVSISSYTRSPVTHELGASFTPPGVPGEILLRLPGERPGEVVTQEFRLTSPGGGAFDWLVGIYGAEIDNLNFNISQWSNYPPPPMTTLVGLQYQTN